MKKRNLFKKGLSAMLCTAMLFNPVLTVSAVTVAEPSESTAVDTQADDVLYSGKIKIEELPSKLIYKVGEELDLSGGMVSSWANIVKNKKAVKKYVHEASPMDVNDGIYTYDVSGFDNTKAGTYTIKIGKKLEGEDEWGTLKNSVNEVEFDVTVVNDLAAIEHPVVDFEISKKISNDANEPINGLKFTLNANIYDIDKDDLSIIECGKYDTKNGNKFSAELPKDIFKKYGDMNKYSVSFEIIPEKVPDGLVMTQNGEYKTDSFWFEYHGDENEKYDIILRDKVVGMKKGDLYIVPPTKLEYKIGEELDLTGGRISGCGTIMVKDLSVVQWDNFGQELSADNLDISEFDNTKAGEYTIKAKTIEFNTDCDEWDDKINYDSFKVKVIGEGVTGSESTGKTEDDNNSPLFKLNFFKFISEEFDGSGENNIINREELKNVKFNLTADIYEYRGEELEKIDAVNIGTFDTADASSIDIKYPGKALKKYSNKDRYFIEYSIRAVDLPEDKVICTENEFYSGAYDEIIISPNDEEKEFDIYFRNKNTVINSGNINVTAPKKLIYHIGEELDLTGGLISGSGGVVDKATGNAMLLWDIFSKELTVNDLDVSAFDSTKPGVYIIKTNVGEAMNGITCDEFINEVNQAKFTVQVLADGASENVSKIKGDANLDSSISLADAVTIMQYIANPDKNKLTEQAKENADVSGDGDGVTSKDALAIQKYKLNLINELPEKSAPKVKGIQRIN